MIVYDLFSRQGIMEALSLMCNLVLKVLMKF